MQARHPFGADEVDRILVRGSKATVEHVGWKYRPEGLTSAQLMQVIERLKARGVVGYQPAPGPVVEPRNKTASLTCKWCGVTYSASYTRHVCKRHRFQLLNHL